ncbi:hypothetical protein VOLCADRAFT_105882 [Volvox carteri f. nagariensis]|uniref:Uncharacterized protein n=1 Tax=Volvox carteri f. nagariensis TaxID=3068 RepID=D8U3V6_VOLCA|nr:uncharacterized protein VOLCADRAFT_105882 [Volvox carteri f. nagariensis]EFJ45597.1 hypothetical protein VOLCADRAFT_105882 [Volvox carteri f. nagariensis]|eukprot:XP_002953287.1 hypothetical protein VOLCADRAFT_105882 [Volvox carteri f. nagariensis]
MWCLFEAHTEANVGCGATVRFRGYTQAVSQHFVKRNAGKSLKVGARALKKTHRHFVSAGSVMQAMYRMLHLGTPHKITQKQFDEAALQTGCKGLTAFAALPYVDLSCLFTVSTGHALLFGVVSDFVDYTLRSLKDIKPADPDAKLVMSREARQRVAARGQFLVVTSDFGRRKSYRMEDWLHFVETFSSYIFKGDVLPEALWALCWSLCSTVTHYFWPRPPDETREQFLVAAKAAACKLRAYTTRLEELEVPGYMFTVNLHICVCWLYSDLPVERMMQQMKTQGGRMVSQAPEKHYTQWLCLMRASESLTEADPGTGAKHTTNQQLERMLARRAVNTEAAWFDKPGANGYLLGRGHMVYPSPERVAQVRAAMASLVHWYALAFEDVASWTLGPSASYELDTDRLDRALMSTPPDCPKARSLLRAEALDEEQYFGAEYGRQQQRISCWACYQAEVGSETRTYAAYLKHFVHLPAEECPIHCRRCVLGTGVQRGAGGGQHGGRPDSEGRQPVGDVAGPRAAAKRICVKAHWQSICPYGVSVQYSNGFTFCIVGKSAVSVRLFRISQEGLAIGGPAPGKATATSNFMTQFQKKVLDKILRPSTITADHGAVAAAVGAEAVDTVANDGDGAAARAAAGDHEQADEDTTNYDAFKEWVGEHRVVFTRNHWVFTRNFACNWLHAPVIHLQYRVIFTRNHWVFTHLMAAGVHSWSALMSTLSQAVTVHQIAALLPSTIGKTFYLDWWQSWNLRKRQCIHTCVTNAAC